MSLLRRFKDRIIEILLFIIAVILVIITFEVMTEEPLTDWLTSPIDEAEINGPLNGAADEGSGD